MSKAKHQKQNKKNKLVPLLIGGIAIAAIVFLIVVIINCNKSNHNNTKETDFIEVEAETFGLFSKTIEIDDPELGHLTLKPINGAKKNNYINENFKTDSNNLKEYYVNGQKASSLGIDISEHQGVVDFEQVKNAGIDFVMLRIGGRGYGDDGVLYNDEMFDTYYEEAKAAKLKVGAYFFSQAVNEEEVKIEADLCIRALTGRPLDYPIAFDFENIENDSARTDDLDGKQISLLAKTFCDEIISKNYKAIIYSNTYLMYYKYDLNMLKDYDFWVADYGDFPSMYYGFTMWQYSIDGEIPGIDGKVDLNLNFKNY